MSFHFVHPSNLIIAGPTGSGKTCFVEQAIREKLFDPIPPSGIVWFYSEWQPAYDRLQSELGAKIRFAHGIQDLVLERFANSIIVIDDQMECATGSKIVADLFTKGSHHRNISVVLLMQNMFLRTRQSRTISLNAQYFIIFKSPRDKSQILSLACQMYPNNVTFLVQAFADATSHGPHSYLLLDLRPETEEVFRVVTRIFPSDGESALEVYVPDNYRMLDLCPGKALYSEF